MTHPLENSYVHLTTPITATVEAKFHVGQLAMDIGRCCSIEQIDHVIMKLPEYRQKRINGEFIK